MHAVIYSKMWQKKYIVKYTPFINTVWATWLSTFSFWHWRSFTAFKGWPLYQVNLVLQKLHHSLYIIRWSRLKGKKPNAKCAFILCGYICVCVCVCVCVCMRVGLWVCLCASSIIRQIPHIYRTLYVYYILLIIYNIRIVHTLRQNSWTEWASVWFLDVLRHQKHSCTNKWNISLAFLWYNMIPMYMHLIQLSTWANHST